MDNKTTGYLSDSVLLGLFAINLVLAVTYVVIQWIARGEIVDAVFVSMLFGATVLLLYVEHRVKMYIEQKGPYYYASTITEDRSETGQRIFGTLIRGVSSMAKPTLIGFGWGGLVASVTFIFDIWPETIVLRSTFLLFMFVTNFVTGVSVYLLATILFGSYRMAKTLDIQLWDLSNSATSFVVRLSRIVSLTAAGYISIAISSVLFSLIDFNFLVVIYTFTASGIFVFALFFPVQPIMAQRNHKKQLALSDLDSRIQKEFDRLCAEMNASETEIDFSTIDSLLAMREKIYSIRSMPFRLKSISASISIVVVAAIPILIQYLLENFF